jgi:hypothetical protein
LETLFIFVLQKSKKYFLLLDGRVLFFEEIENLILFFGNNNLFENIFQNFSEFFLVPY